MAEKVVLTQSTDTNELKQIEDVLKQDGRIEAFARVTQLYKTNIKNTQIVSICEKPLDDNSDISYRLAVIWHGTDTVRQIISVTLPSAEDFVVDMTGNTASSDGGFYDIQWTLTGVEIVVQKPMI